MVKFKALNFEGKEVWGVGVLELVSGEWILFTEKGYEVNRFEEEHGAALFEYVRKETIEIVK